MFKTRSKKKIPCLLSKLFFVHLCTSLLLLPLLSSSWLSLSLILSLYLYIRYVPLSYSLQFIIASVYDAFALKISRANYGKGKVPSVSEREKGISCWINCQKRETQRYGERNRDYTWNCTCCYIRINMMNMYFH